jgi:hypothetical protein
MRRLLVLLPLALGACQIASPFTDPSPGADIPQECRDYVYADPKVKFLLEASAGSESFGRQHAEELRYAKIAAAHKCLQMKGLTRSGGGVEPPALRN